MTLASCPHVHVELQNELVEAIATRFDFEFKGTIDWFLGVHVARGDGWLTLDMNKYISDKVKQFGIVGKRVAATPFPSKLPSDMGGNLCESEATMYSTLLTAEPYVTHRSRELRSEVMHMPDKNCQTCR